MKNVVVKVLLGFVALLAGSTGVRADSVEELAFFEKKIRPILANQCYECHSAEAKKSKGGLFLDTREGLMKGGDAGPALVAGQPDKSLLIRAVRYGADELRMPPKKKLTDAEIADLVAWVKMGAPDPRKSEATAIKYGMTLEEGRKFWAYQPVPMVPVPPVKNTAWPKTPVDNFILARIEAAGITPSASAERRALLRRVTFDLTGLPPTPAEMAAFLADTSTEAFAKVVDRLLESPRYGERWGRHWLDVVRYADTCGNASDYPVPQAHRYRDWVIGALQKDMPYDQFLREQIAGDLMPAANEQERQDRIIATGYLAIARRFGGSRFGEHHLTLEDTIDNVGRAILGISLSCARCHDHKFDPFTMSDYYGLYGIFSSTRYPFPGAEVKKQQEDFVPLQAPALFAAATAKQREKLAFLDEDIKKLQIAELRAKSSTDKNRIAESSKALAEARQMRADVQAEIPAYNDAYAVAEAQPANARMHLRGDPKRLGDEVPRHFPAILGGQELGKNVTGSGRLQLAQWLTDAKNPLTARVMVNRLWQYHFGIGLVQTPNDFGRQGKAPSHPELLDYLAARFMADGWSIKAMHRLILLSQTWQLASTETATGVKADPTNELFWRHTRRRLDAESIRDAMLFVSGELDLRTGLAHPFPPAKTWGFTQHAPFVAVYETRQRSVYLMQQRQRKHPYLALFDGPDPSSSTGIRQPSTTPLQALFLMNDPLAHQVAAKLAERVLTSVKADTDRLNMAYQVVLGRIPEVDELKECGDFLHNYRNRLTTLKTPADQIEPRAWAALARAILSSNEFIYVD